MPQRLFIFAHKGEAQIFIQKMQMKLEGDFSPLSNKAEFYQNKNDALLVSGEGIHKVILNLTHLLTIHPEIEEIYNFGIAGLLDSKKKKEIGNIYPINICYNYREKNFTYQSFSTNVLEKKVSFLY